jgi:hypothetical protein
MATKSKGKKSVKKSKKSNGAKKLSFTKQTPAYYKAIASAIGKGKVPETSGELIRARLVEGKLDADAIVTEVKRRFKGSTTKKSDVYWQRGRLKKEGIKLASTRRAAAE